MIEFQDVFVYLYYCPLEYPRMKQNPVHQAQPSSARSIQDHSSNVQQRAIPPVHQLEDIKDEVQEDRPLPAPFVVQMYNGDEDEIDEVTTYSSLQQFTTKQNEYQGVLKAMDGLQSAGFEFEFASFTATPASAYTKEEIVPSHQEMARSADLGKYFHLPWKLESDSYNTLELVTPPFVFRKNAEGDGKRNAAKNEINKELAALAGNFDKTTLPAVVGKLSGMGLGTGWNINDKYQEFGVISNQKSGQGKVYDQANVSLFPHEIGALMLERFETENKANFPEQTMGFPTAIAGAIKKALDANLPPQTGEGEKEKAYNAVAVQQAIAIFARYASNAIAIPSMRHRQDNHARKDAKGTDVKETLGVWVKTDALNLLKPILASSADCTAFKQALKGAQDKILEIFKTDGAAMIEEEQKKIAEAQKAQQPAEVDRVKLAGIVKELMALQKAKKISSEIKIADLPKLGTKVLQKKAEDDRLSTEAALQKIQEEESGPPAIPASITALEGYVALMLQEVAAFTSRAMAVEEHEESQPEMTTAQFLEEKYGDGKGVRKGTYLKGIPTSAGNMYVTELR